MLKTSLLMLILTLTTVPAAWAYTSDLTFEMTNRSDTEVAVEYHQVGKGDYEVHSVEPRDTWQKEKHVTAYFNKQVDHYYEITVTSKDKSLQSCKFEVSMTNTWSWGAKVVKCDLNVSDPGNHCLFQQETFNNKCSTEISYFTTAPTAKPK